MLNEGYQFFGVLYIGAILTKDGPKVIEFNARFGDPEAQVLLSRMESDLMQHIIDLDEGKRTEFKWKNESIVGVMLASKGYPDAYEKGHKVSGFDLNENYFVSGLKKQGDTFVTSGGRVILAIGKVTMYKMHSETHTKKYLKYKVTIYSIVMTLRIKHYNLNKYI